MVSKTSRVSASGKFPPSIARLPSQPDPREPSPEQLEQIIRRLPLKKGEEDNSAAEARELLAGYASARLGQLWQRKRKSGAAGPKVVRHLKQIASRSSTLLERLKRADRNTFEAWAAAQYPEAVTLKSATQEWLQLKNLLEVTAQRAAQSAGSVDKALKSLPRPQGGKRGRPIDQVADLVTIEAAAIYGRRTGKNADRNIDRASGTPVGDFHEFLTRVFEVLQIKSSPDARNMQLQTELRGMKKK